LRFRSVIGSVSGKLQPFLPYISDGGAFAPEKNIFAMLQNLSAVLVALLNYVKHAQLVSYYQSRRSDHFWKVLSAITAVLGFIAAFALGIVGDFSECDNGSLHYWAAFVTFVAASLHMMVAAGLSFLRPLLCSRPVAFLRVFIAALAAALLIFLLLTNKLGLFIPLGSNITEYKGDDEPVFLEPNSPFYLHHNLASSSEWLFVFCILFYFVTLVDEFRKSTLTLPYIHFYGERQPTDFEKATA
ncbi:hypothetical protein PMAYCL1PPCAC_15041, partial [Pristionchus mayeri]